MLKYIKIINLNFREVVKLYVKKMNMQEKSRRIYIVSYDAQLKKISDM